MFPSEIGDKELYVMFGDLHLEKQSIVVIGQLLEGSSWIELLVEAGITTSGVTQSFLTTSHIKKQGALMNSLWLHDIR